LAVGITGVDVLLAHLWFIDDIFSEVKTHNSGELYFSLPS
jgi:hypothetical protein